MNKCADSHLGGPPEQRQVREEVRMRLLAQRLLALALGRAGVSEWDAGAAAASAFEADASFCQVVRDQEARAVGARQADAQDIPGVGQTWCCVCAACACSRDGLFSAENADLLLHNAQGQGKGR